MALHALLSPSSASRWMVCTPSARLEQSLPDRTSSYADEGGLAHALAELLILRLLHRIREPNFKIRLAKIKNSIYYEPAMLEHCQDYAAYVMATYAKALKIDSQAVIFIEAELNMERYIPEGFGTGDVLIGCRGFLWFIDLKYGKGVAVYAQENKQLMIYGLGGLELMDLFFSGITQISLAIFQPRIDNNSEWMVSRKDLEKWAEKELKPVAAIAFKGEGEFVAGLHCQFCDAKNQCRANSKFRLSLSAFAKKPAHLLSDEEIAEILTKDLAGLVSWVNSLKEFVLQKAIQGKKWKGWKLVAGRSDRRITDALSALKILRGAGYTKEELTTLPKLKGIGELEKIIGKKDFNYYLKNVIEKPYGSPTLVIESDPRPLYNKNKAAKNAFNKE